ncbi:glutathione peroxidase [Neobacillus kokaensis]|uniref:Glutathione peroxidase n=1 Tax=Neobacillus kokaensis TaxID=2759023 RepID=A0ABQ3N7R9_9BACI|nr:glutathione peroxidase [Neobacillus kokaensis]GHI00743.1 glutathione peroxidase [Neobacillus kokaensis]
MRTVYDFSVKMPDGTEKALKDYEGQPLIIVNTASKCGFTPQFKGLQELYEQYKEQGLVILGFPCAQFHNQEFENIAETTAFCQMNYGVTFPMFAKIDVNGSDADPLFNYLTEQKKGVLSSRIKWNFTKFLIDRNGQVTQRYAPTTDPKKIEADLLKLL